MTKKFFAIAVFLIFSIVPAVSAAGRYMASTGTNVRVRATPSTNAKILYTINKGQYVCVIGQKILERSFNGTTSKTKRKTGMVGYMANF